MKLLIVEDEHRIANYIKKGLELKNHTVDVAYDGESGLNLALSVNYDVIILDRMLPKIDGVEICRQMRLDNNHAPVLMLTAKNLVSDRVHGLEAGADDYLGKPFAFIELLSRIQALARRPRQVVNNRLQTADLTLDTVDYQVSRDGIPLKLSQKEFALLEFLMRHPNQVFTAQKLTEHVWSYDSDVLPNTAQVYLGYLRNKVDRAFPDKTPLIHTLRGFGYRLGTNRT